MSEKSTTLKRVYKKDADFLRITFPNMTSASAVNLGVSLLRRTDLANMLRVERIKRNVKRK